MKKLAIFTLFSFLFTGAFAQDIAEFGIKGGLNLSGYLADDNLNLYQDNTSASVGADVGFYGVFHLSDKFAIQPEVLYSLQSVNFVEPEAYVDYVYVDGFFGPDFVVSEVGTYGDVEAQQNLHYLNVPVLANIYLTEGLSLQIGPQIGFLLNGTARLDPNDEQVAGLITDFEDQIDITDRLNRVSLAASAGLQYELPSNLNLGLRYNFGLTDVVDDTEDVVSLTNQVGQLYLGYTF